MSLNFTYPALPAWRPELLYKNCQWAYYFGWHPNEMKWHWWQINKFNSSSCHSMGDKQGLAIYSKYAYYVNCKSLFPLINVNLFELYRCSSINCIPINSISVLIAAHALIGAHSSYNVVLSKNCKKKPNSSKKSTIYPALFIMLKSWISIWLGITPKTVQIIHFWVNILAENKWSKHPGCLLE